MEPEYDPLSGRLKREPRPVMQNLPGTLAGELERVQSGQRPSCCVPTPCGWPIGVDPRRFKAMLDDWDEERQGWSGL
jgi:hypothetical protein